MPGPFVAKAGVIAVTIAVPVALAVALAIYESPQLKNIATDLRRRIALAFHAFGDTISPQERDTLLNHPEDAEGFLESRGLGPGSVPGVDADAESLRRQREELLYWNAVRESKKEMASEKEQRHRPRASTAASSFDDFLQRDESDEKGALIFQTSHSPQNRDGMIRRRGNEHMSDLQPPSYVDSVYGEHEIEDDIAFENSLMSPEHDEMSDIYSATDVDPQEPSHNATTSSHLKEAVSEMPQPQSALGLSERELNADESMTTVQVPQHDSDIDSSIEAWAQGSSHDSSFYTPLPVSRSPFYIPEEGFATDGELTPLDSASLADGADVANRSVSARSFDMMSDDEGMLTPASWTEVGSVVSESDGEGGLVHD